ncbi:hypothetical protein CKF54_03860 [Psittacicella hinzii]|uniref:Aminotransferase class V domain-containing protein n=1 Tax=Psittacicella hinzii TaxID=2028575 RepID=A0A3A1Y5Q0_9GAMM|nr:aminotransferase class V-fold PLP-dependent enzyme [Psittacicella hinzii]RIY32945.1 hypothetical protein CKF54_03860 [Psittacicella hinzii]
MYSMQDNPSLQTLSELSEKIDSYSSLVEQFREQFPVLDQAPIYFDNAATSLRPQVVLESFTRGFAYAGNVERSLHTFELSALIKSGNNYLKNYFDPREDSQLVYTANTTQAINLLAQTLGEFWCAQKNAANSQETYYILVGQSNHHANLLPWIKLCQQYSFLQLKYIPLKEDLTFDLDYLQNFCQEHANNLLLVSISSVDNSNGMVHPIGKIKQILDTFSPHAWLALDNAQGSTYNQIYLEKAGCTDYWPADFLIGSLHKMFGLTGIGYLITTQRINQLKGKEDKDINLLTKFFKLSNEFINSQEKSNEEFIHLNLPYKGNSLNHQLVGGGFVKSINLDKVDYQLKDTNPFLIAGTPNINAQVTVKDTIKWLNNQPLRELYDYTHLLQQYFLEHLRQFNDVLDLSNATDAPSQLEVASHSLRILPSFGHHISLSIEDGQDIDLGQELAKHNISVRVGKHCAYPYHDFLGVDSTLRISLAPYNTREEVEYAVEVMFNFFMNL